MDWKSAQIKDDGLIKVPERWLHLHYYEALNILFRFENSLRVFVYVILKNDQLEKWAQSSFELNGEQKSIKGVAAKRIKQAENFGYLGFEVKSPLMHLTSGELVELITSNAYWPKFKSHFKGNKDIIKNKLLEIGTVRNSLAHFRPLKPEDLELIKQNSRHTLMGVEECLKNIYNFPVRVPTNTQEEWYKSLVSLGNEYITITPYYSNNEKWVNARIDFKSPQLDKTLHGTTFYSFIVGKINPANIFTNNQKLGKYSIYVSQYVNQPSFVENNDVSVNTTINMVFSKEQLESSHAEIMPALKETCLKILEECQLLTQDKLARGEIIEAANVAIWYSGEGESAKWTYSYDTLWQNYEPDHPDEYWGTQQFSNNDVVAGSTHYPWMQSDVSKYESPF
mgnify:CR=1 FL=1